MDIMMMMMVKWMPLQCQTNSVKALHKQ